MTLPKDYTFAGATRLSLRSGEHILYAFDNMKNVRAVKALIREYMMCPTRTRGVGDMNSAASVANLKLSLMRALLGNILPDLRQASIAADEDRRVVQLRFEFDGEPSEESREACSCAATEVISDFAEGWNVEEEYAACAFPAEMNPLSHIVFRRAEPDTCPTDSNELLQPTCENARGCAMEGKEATSTPPASPPS